FVFSKKLADEYGLFEAVFLSYIIYWIEQNSLRGKPCAMYTTAKRLHQRFSFVSLTTINRTISNLRKRGAIVTKTRISKKTRFPVTYFYLGPKFSTPLVNLTNSR